MKKIIAFLTINMFLFVFNNLEVNAECTYTEKASLNKIAANVKVNYEIDKKTTKLSDLGIPAEDPEAVSIEYLLKLNITNLSKEVYITGEESKTGETFSKNYNDLVDGLATITYNDVSFIRKYTFKLYGSNESACPGEVLKTFYLTLPMYNPYYIYCSEDTDYYLCKEFITNEVTEEQFFTKYNDYISKDEVKKEDLKEESNKWYDEVIEFVLKNKIYFILVMVLIGASFGIYIYRKTKRQKELGLWEKSLYYCFYYFL